MKLKLAIVITLLAVALPAAAETYEDYQRRHADLIALSGVFGELHYIRRTCEPRYEADVWRERMKKLIDLEQPQESARDEMIAVFNAGYKRAQTNFTVCNSRARDYAAAKAAQGDEIVDRLLEPLYQTMEQDRELPPVMSVTGDPEH